MSTGLEDDDTDLTLLEDGDQQDDITVEQRARALGWKPLQEYRGDPRRWSDAAAFITKGEEELPVLRDNIRRSGEKLVRQDSEIAAMRATIEEQGEAIRNAMQMARTANVAGYNRAITELKAKQREAAAEADVETYDQIGREIEAAETERAALPDPGVVTSKVKPAETKPEQKVDPETLQFVADNPWFNSNPILNQAMIAAHAALFAKEGKVMGEALADQYARAKAEVVDMFPHKFRREVAPVPDDHDLNPTPAPSPRPRPRLALDPTAPRNPRNPRSPFDQIEDPAERAEARKAYEGIKRWDTGATEEEYVTLYLNPKLNPIELREQRNKKAH